MEKPEQKQGYSLLAKGLHWGFVLLFAYGIFKQVDDLNQLADSALFRFEMGFALVFLLVVLLRYLYMSRTQETALPADTPRWQKIAARTVHLGLYASLAGIALSGLLARMRNGPVPVTLGLPSLGDLVRYVLGVSAQK